MKKHVLQWHITHKCNLRCLHCYQDDYSKDLTLSQIEKVLDDYQLFLKQREFRGHINLTGGEPFVYPWLFRVLDLLEARGFTFGLLTNGTLIDEEAAKKLSQYKGLSFVQISLDGVKKTHERIRGKGTFDKSLKALHLLRKYKVCTMVSFTAQKSNYKELKRIIRIVKYHRVNRFWTDRLIPMNNKEEILSTNEFLAMIQTLTKEARKAEMSHIFRTKVHLNRALQFCGGNHEIYHCSAGNELLTILANGDLLVCRRLPIVLGNVLSSSIQSLFEGNPIIRQLTQVPKECRSCYKAELCRGGLRCLTYAVTEDFEKKDINCPVIT